MLLLSAIHKIVLTINGKICFGHALYIWAFRLFWWRLCTSHRHHSSGRLLKRYEEVKKFHSKSLMKFYRQKSVGANIAFRMQNFGTVRMATKWKQEVEIKTITTHTLRTAGNSGKHDIWTLFVISCASKGLNMCVCRWRLTNDSLWRD